MRAAQRKTKNRKTKGARKEKICAHAGELTGLYRSKISGSSHLGLEREGGKGGSRRSPEKEGAASGFKGQGLGGHSEKLVALLAGRIWKNKGAKGGKKMDGWGVGKGQKLLPRNKSGTLLGQPPVTKKQWGNYSKRRGRVESRSTSGGECWGLYRKVLCWESGRKKIWNKRKMFDYEKENQWGSLLIHGKVQSTAISRQKKRGRMKNRGKIGEGGTAKSIRGRNVEIEFGEQIQKSPKGH